MDETKLKEYARDDVFKHNRPDDAWFIIDPYIYDVTGYQDHPGGRSALVHNAGKDVTIPWNMQHSTRLSAFERLKDFRIGYLRKEDR